MKDMYQATLLSGQRVFHLKPAAAAVAVRGKAEGLQIEEEADVVAPLVSREDGSSEDVRDGCKAKEPPGPLQHFFGAAFADEPGVDRLRVFFAIAARTFM